MVCINLDIPTDEELLEIHKRGHFGTERTLALARERFGSTVSKKRIKRLVRSCEPCARYDPAVTNKWDRGKLQSAHVWDKLAVDITHVRNEPYLSIIDTSSQFMIWRKWRSESAREVCGCMEQVISEFGPPNDILSGNGTVFRSREFVELLKRWEIEQNLSCAYRPQGNGIIERSHRTVKRSVARSSCSVAEAVFWLNNSRTSSAFSPFELLFSMQCKKPGICNTGTMLNRSELPNYSPVDPANSSYSDIESNPFIVGDQVYLRPNDGKCDKKWTGPHRITKLLSRVSVVINDDGVARHISHLRKVSKCQSQNSSV